MFYDGVVLESLLVHVCGKFRAARGRKLLPPTFLSRSPSLVAARARESRTQSRVRGAADRGSRNQRTPLR